MKAQMANGNTKSIVWASLLLTLAFTSRSYSDPLPITVLDSHYTTIVSDRREFPTPIDLLGYTSPSTNPFTGVVVASRSRTQASSMPVSDTLLDKTGLTIANATGVGLEASVLTLTGYRPGWDQLVLGAGASVQSVLSFSPVTSQTQSITLEFARFYLDFYTAGNVRLVNVTSGQELWNYNWSGLSGGNISWVDMSSSTNYPIPTYPYPNTFPYLLTGLQPRSAATLTLATDFNASDIYELSMYVNAGSDHDHEGASIKVLGLQVVPEPSAFALVSLAAIGLLNSRRRAR